ncbi:glutathione S-transferase [Gloeopeniophorella convolvens]|nr:glutathione S-transferase [Gloeopeniophorella convolvens]
MTLKIYGWPVSSCVRRAAHIAKERGIPYEFIQLDKATNVHKGAEYLSHQPFGVVPYINDDGFEMYESRAISRYLVVHPAGRGPAFIPKDLHGLARFEQAVSVETSYFQPQGRDIILALREGYKDLSDPHFGAIVARIEPTLDIYEQILSKQKYLAGDEITLADFFHLPYGNTFVEEGLGLFEKRPNVWRWWQDISSRPAWQAVKVTP